MELVAGVTLYRQQLVRNTDFRKFDDGLRMTLDCTPELATRIEELLVSGKHQGLGATAFIGRPRR
jgi:hypothetical protein